MYMARLNMSSFEKMRGKIDTVVIPIGTTEAHGPHCALGTDFMIPDHFAAIIDSRIGDKSLIAPTINYGCSWNLSVFPGTINVSSETFAAYIYEICQSFIKWGITNIVFLNGHGGNRPALTMAAQKVANTGGAVLIVNWWLDYMKDILTICDGRGHAGEDETSAVLAIDESLVDMSKATVNWNKLKGQIFTKDINKVYFNGAITGDGTLATVEKGRKIFKVVGDKIVELIRDFMSGDYVIS